LQVRTLGAHVPLGDALFERMLALLSLVPRIKSHYDSSLDTEKIGRIHNYLGV